ncbi:MAG: UxaA family hydrolase, partial [Ilumatobacteraceae bacterium]
MIGYRRSDGRYGIRNLAVVVYLVECARHVVDKIVSPFDERQVHAIGFSGCFRNEYSAAMMQRLCTHPNVGAVLLVSLGCEGFDRARLEQHVAASGRPVHTLVIQESGGSLATIAAGRAWITEQAGLLEAVQGESIGLEHLVVGTICGGSDSTSGLTANPAVGSAFDAIITAGGTGIFEETGELIGCEAPLRRRAITEALGEELDAAVRKASAYYDAMGQPSFAPGNADGGITTIEEKSLGAYLKSGTSPISGLLKPTELAPTPGLYLLDVVPDGDLRWGFPNISDNAEIGELMACGAQVIVFTTGRGSV